MTSKSTPSAPPAAPPPAAPKSARSPSVAPVALRSAKVPSVPPPSLPPRSSSRLYGGTWAAGVPEILAADSGHCIGRYEGVLICIWRDAPTLAALETASKLFAAMTEDRPNGAGILGVAEEGMPTIGAMERRLAGDLFADLGRRALFVASVVEGDGFWASTARSVMTAIGIVARRPCPLRIFRFTSEAAEWQARFPTDAAAPPLSEAIERCRAQMAPP